MQICFKNEAYPAHHIFHLKTFCDDWKKMGVKRPGLLEPENLVIRGYPQFFENNN